MQKRQNQRVSISGYCNISKTFITEVEIGKWSAGHTLNGKAVIMGKEIDVTYTAKNIWWGTCKEFNFSS